MNTQTPTTTTQTPAQTAQPITPATIRRHWLEFAHAFERANSIDERNLSRAWNDFSRYMESITLDLTLAPAN